MPILRKIGNSAGITIPARVLIAAGITLGDKLDIDANHGRIIIRKAAPSYLLEQLLEGVTPEMIDLDQDDLNWVGSAVGKELIDL